MALIRISFLARRSSFEKKLAEFEKLNVFNELKLKLKKKLNTELELPK